MCPCIAVAAASSATHASTACLRSFAEVYRVHGPAGGGGGRAGAGGRPGGGGDGGLSGEEFGGVRGLTADGQVMAEVVRVGGEAGAVVSR